MPTPHCLCALQQSLYGQVSLARQGLQLVQCLKSVTCVARSIFITPHASGDGCCFSCAYKKNEKLTNTISCPREKLGFGRTVEVSAIRAFKKSV